MNIDKLVYIIAKTEEEIVLNLVYKFFYELAPGDGCGTFYEDPISYIKVRDVSEGRIRYTKLIDPNYPVNAPFSINYDIEVVSTYSTQEDFISKIRFGSYKISDNIEFNRKIHEILNQVNRIMVPNTKHLKLAIERYNYNDKVSRRRNQLLSI